MKLIHLSDLHIGKRVEETPMLEDQQYILACILQVIDTQKPDAVLICGDVYDKSIPPAEAVTAFDDFLCSLSRRKVPVMVISGNHDSAERLAFGGRLMELSGIYLSPIYDGKINSVTLTDENGPVDFWLMPFMKPVHVRRYFPDANIESYTDACRTVVESLPLDKSRRNVLLTHQFVTGASPCDSEEKSVGGADNVDAAVFADFDYVALGHIHGPQNMTPRIRYCGSPLKYSFSERDHKKSVTVVELKGKEVPQVTEVPLLPLRDVRQIRGTFDRLTDKAYYSATATEDYLHIVLTDEEDVPEAAGRLRAIYHNMMVLSYDNSRTRAAAALDTAQVTTKSPLELFADFYAQQYNAPMSEVQTKYMTELLESLREEEQ